MSTPQIHTMLTAIKPSMLNLLGQTVLLAVVFTLVKVVISC
jgi:hypothetical protein